MGIFLNSFLGAFIAGHFVFKHIFFKDLDYVLGRNVVLLAILLAFFGCNKRLISGSRSAVMGVIIGTLWGFLHTGNPRIFMMQSMNPDLSNLGEIYSEHWLGSGRAQRLLIKKDIGCFQEIQVRPVVTNSPAYLLGSEGIRPNKDCFKAKSILLNIQKFIENRVKSQVELKDAIEKRRIESWLLGIVLGQSHQIGDDLKGFFQRTGLYHLLSLGGLHVSMLSLFFFFVIRGPFIFFYFMFLIPKPIYWHYVWFFLSLTVLLVAFIFMSIVGADPAIQRTVIGLAVTVIIQCYLGRLPKAWSYLLGLGIQAILYPIGFFSPGNIMSWICYLRIVSEFQQMKRLNIGQKVGRCLRLHSELAVYSAAFFGHFSMTGLLVNAPLVPVFSFVFFLSWFAVLLGFEKFSQWMVFLNQAFLDLIESLALSTDRINWLYYNLAEMSWEVRGFFVVLSSYFALNLISKTSITKLEDITHGQRYLERKKNHHRG